MEELALALALAEEEEVDDDDDDDDDCAAPVAGGTGGARDGRRVGGGGIALFDAAFFIAALRKLLLSLFDIFLLRRFTPGLSGFRSEGELALSKLRNAICPPSGPRFLFLGLAFALEFCFVNHDKSSLNTSIFFSKFSLNVHNLLL